MQSSGSADGMRNLIDSSLVKSIHTILIHSNLFGHVGAFGLAVNIMSTFIHNEPTSLSILQEAQLPLAFLTAANKPLQVSVEVVSALPNAFGALCLNTVGLEQFVSMNPIDLRLDTLLNDAHLKSVLDNHDVPHLNGNIMDENIQKIKTASLNNKVYSKCSADRLYQASKVVFKFSSCARCLSTLSLYIRLTFDALPFILSRSS
jgi:E3 ubiquitin-protein ligase HUWE1